MTVESVIKREKIHRKERISKRQDFIRLLKRGKRYYSTQYTVIITPNNLDYVRFGLSIGRKVGNAVFRNYEKRVCREFFRKERDWFIKGKDILIIIKKQTQDYHTSYNTLKSLLHKSLR
ncbi:MAG: hypothetical protein AMS17_05780 [Spirochaetes bacterium DG_61]|nr:MAG: hypothetical protein AMS17_05780 [Spirochaetes bacterium DG_61]